jgi:hypothetical protein
VTFEKGELEQLLGVTKVNTPELKERLKHLMGNVVQIDDPSMKKGFRLVSLFEEAVAEQEEDGQWIARMECTRAAMKYFFNVDNLGYLRYKLRCITSLTSRYSYVLFVYIEANRFRKSWEIGLDELKRLLNCDGVQTYDQFKEFNKQILKKCHSELSKKTECHFIYEPIRKGRSVSAIRFTVDTLPALEPVIDPNQLTLFGCDEQETTDDQIVFLSSACPEFTHAEMEQIFEILVCVPDGKLPIDTTTGTDSLEFRRYHYLAERYAALRREAEKKQAAGRGIKNRFAYFTKMLKRDSGVE